MSDDYPKWVLLDENVGRVLAVSADDESALLAWWRDNRAQAAAAEAREVADAARSAAAEDEGIAAERVDALPRGRRAR